MAPVSSNDFKTGLTILMGWCMHAHTESEGESKREELGSAVQASERSRAQACSKTKSVCEV